MKGLEGKSGPAAVARALVVFLEARGKTRPEIASVLSQAPEAWAGTEKVPLADELALWEMAAELEPEVGLILAQQAEARALGLVGYVMASQKDLRGLFTSFARHHRLIHDEARLELRPWGDGEALCHGFSRPGKGPGPEASHFSLAAFYRIAAQESGRSLPLVEVHWQSVSQVSEDRLSQAFGGAPQYFGEAQNRLVFAPGVLDFPLKGGGDPGLRAVLEQAGQAALAQLPPVEDWTEVLRGHVARNLDREDFGQELVARLMGLSARSLQRRLAEKKLEFRQLVEEVRQNLAQTYLGRPDLNLTEVAFLLGYAESSSFTRAFRRWSGLTPSQYRSKAQAQMQGGEQ